MRVLRTLLFLPLFVAPFAPAATPPTTPGADIQIKVEKFQLKNGLTVLIHEDHSAPFVSYQQWFRVGSKHETPGLTGLAHFFEHLMFKGTPKFPGDTFDRMIRSNGGASNAFTTRDFTGYYINLPSDKLPLAVAIESDRMRNLNFDQKEINSEREVVKEERRMRVDNDVNGTLDEKLWRTVFKVHPYHWPVIGSMVDLNRATIDDMKDFYRVHYAPNNAVVVVAGDVDSTKVKKLVTEAYEGIPSQEIKNPAKTEEPSQQSERRAVISKEVQSPTVSVAFRTVASGEDDMYPLDLAANILGAGQSSRLYRRLVYRNQTVSGVNVSSYTPQDSGMFRIAASVKPGVGVEGVIGSIGSEVKKLREDMVSDAELEKAKNQVMKDYVESLKTISGKANALAIHEVYGGDYTSLYRDLEKYLAVTKEDIQRVAKKYLQQKSRSIVIVQPGAAAAATAEEAKPATAER